MKEKVLIILYPLLCFLVFLIFEFSIYSFLIVISIGPNWYSTIIKSPIFLFYILPHTINYNIFLKDILYDLFRKNEKNKKIIYFLWLIITATPILLIDYNKIIIH